MNKYETVVIINPNVDEEGVKALVSKYEKVINKEGKVEKTDIKEKKALAYEVKKNKEGIFVVFNYEANPTLISEFERQMRIEDDIIKYMTINVNEKN